MPDIASQVCVFGAGLYEAKKRRKATFKIDASQAGLIEETKKSYCLLLNILRSWATFGWSLFFTWTL
jgi:hypothetical protein